MFFQNVQPSFQNNNTTQAQEIRHFLLTMPETADNNLVPTSRPQETIKKTFLTGALTWSHPTLAVPKPKVPKTYWLSNGGSKISRATKMTVAFLIWINILNACAVNNIIGFWLPSICGILDACWGFLITKEVQEHPELHGCTLKIMNHFCYDINTLLTNYSLSKPIESLQAYISMKIWFYQRVDKGWITTMKDLASWCF